MNLLSKIQKLTSEFLPNLFEETEWKTLKDQEKNQFAQAFMGRARSDADLAEALESLRTSMNRDSEYFVNRMSEIEDEENGRVNLTSVSEEDEQ